LSNKEPHVRLWTVRLLCDEKNVPEAIAVRLAGMARSEADLHVRSQLACSARRLPASQGLLIVRGLLARDEDANDPHMPLLLWWAIEARCDSDRSLVLAMFAETPLWELAVVREHILERLMRRFAAAGTRKDLLTCAELFQLAHGPKQSQALMAGFEKAFEGRSLPALPPPLVAALAKAGGGSLALRVRLSDGAAVDQALGVITDEKAKPQERLRYVQIFGEVNQPRCVEPLLTLLEKSRDDGLRSAVLAALQPYRDARITPAVLRLHNALPADVRETAQTLLASRQGTALDFLRAIEAGKIDRRRQEASFPQQQGDRIAGSQAVRRNSRRDHG
jgi:hypothetical protein